MPIVSDGYLKSSRFSETAAGDWVRSALCGGQTTVSGPRTAWLAAKLGRKVRIKFGELEAEAQNVDELRKLLDLVDEFRKNEGRR